MRTVGWLNLAQGPQVLHVPDMAARYYSVQFTDPAKNTNFAYVGKRTTGTAAGDYLVSGPGWQGEVPPGMAQIAAPNNAVLVLGRVLVESDTDLPTAHGLAKQIQLTPLSQYHPPRYYGPSGRFLGCRRLVCPGNSREVRVRSLPRFPRARGP